MVSKPKGTCSIWFLWHSSPTYKPHNLTRNGRTNPNQQRNWNWNKPTGLCNSHVEKNLYATKHVTFRIFESKILLFIGVQES